MIFPKVKVNMSKNTEVIIFVLKKNVLWYGASTIQKRTGEHGKNGCLVMVIKNIYALWLY